MRRESLQRAWLGVLAALVLVTIALWLCGMRVNYGAKGLAYFWCAALCLIFSFHFQPGSVWAQRVLLFFNGMLLASAISLCGGLASYWITSVSSFPFADDLLYRADLAIGLDWREIYHRYRTLDWLVPIMQNFYLVIFYTPMLVLLGLSATGQAERIKLFLMATAISLVPTLAIYALLPAKTALLYLIGTHPPYVPVTGLCCTDIINDLRSGNIGVIEIHKMFGLVTFPSYHAATAVLLSWACWTMRLYRWPITILNAGMLVATPLEGAHYFVDIAGGIWVALASICAAQRLAAPNPFARFRPAALRLSRGKLPDLL